MKFIHSFLLIAALTLLIGCTGNKKAFSTDVSKKWHTQDYISSGIPGISLEKALLNAKKTNRSIIVATIDNQLDTEHEDLKEAIWTNKNEIPDNKIDDDSNGYVDDIHGWNFLGTKSGNYIVWGNFEYTRIVREYEVTFKDKKKEDLNPNDWLKYEEYQRAAKFQDKWGKYYANFLKSLNYRASLYLPAKDTLKHYFPKEDYTIKQLDSMYNLYKINNKSYKERRDTQDKDFGALIAIMKITLEMGNSYEDLIDNRSQIDSIANKNSNKNYNERLFIGDNEKVLEKKYGNNKVNAKIAGIRSNNSHNTKVSSLIAANRKNKIGIQGFSDNIKIMPLAISASGDEHDKDIAMAVRYAVDNGAKVINMSFTKEFSLHPEWVIEAFQYAEKNNVLLVHASGNDAFSVDENPTYPNDYYYDKREEVCSNLINVGSVSAKLDSTFVSGFSNYGKYNVDVFAPGEKIYTAIPENKYDFDSGTSLAAPMVSGTAALIWLYYPTLTVQQVKQIIMDSGTPYNIEVLLPGGEGKKVPFKDLSKTGKVINVDNALKMAEKMSKQKKNDQLLH